MNKIQAEFYVNRWDNISKYEKIENDKMSFRSKLRSVSVLYNAAKELNINKKREIEICQAWVSLKKSIKNTPK